MNYYEFTAYINTLCEDHPRVESFSLDDIFGIDDLKGTLFPLCNLIINNITISESKMTYNLSLLMADRVNEINGRSTGTGNDLFKDYKGVSNIVDVHNDTLLSLSDIISYLRRNPDAFNYEILGDAILTPFEDRFSNLLAGWVAIFDVEVPYDGNICAINSTVNP